MSMMELLYRTYEYAYRKEDRSLMENYLMSQTMASAPIVLWITEKGAFADATYLTDKEKQKISIPCTEKSAGRSGTNPVPHPLFDKLLYLAGNAEARGINNQKAHETYMHNLKDWCESSYGNRYVKTVYAYLEKNTLLWDLEGAGILDFTEEKELKKRLNEVVRIGIRRDFQTDLELWRENEIREDFCRYLGNGQENRSFCYISGEEGTISENHPKSIWNLKANAKLISANEKANRGLVYSGRFETANQAVQVSYETSQKVHNALKWLIQKQGKMIGDKLLVAWGMDGGDFKNVIEGTDFFFNEEEEDTVMTADTQAEFAYRLEKAIFRQEQDLKHNEKVGFLVLEAATPGRLSISYYQEFTSVQYLSLVQALKAWHEEHAWYYYSPVEGKKTWAKRIMCPSLYSIALFAEGVDRSDKMDADQKILGNTMTRLLPCVLEGKAIPSDIRRKLLIKAHYPLNYKEQNWRKLIKITCSILREQYREVGTMDVNKDSKDIHYNYGRWLAAAHEIERRALWKSGGERETNALRLFTKFAEHPNKYMMVIQKKIQIYEEKLGDKANWLRKVKREISANLTQNPLEELMGTRDLDGRMILGFETQMNEFGKKEEENK